MKIRLQYEGHSRHVLLAAFSAHMDYSKRCMMMDKDVDILNLNDIWKPLELTITSIVTPGFCRDTYKGHWRRPRHRRDQGQAKLD
ncbi:MAG: UbiD family decarboxylase [Rhodospirillaceae bacterium]|nr:UbiD family decarboxylase [Rhodospirillaceae bacterium]MCY4311535.1 UbiD family decarboxylase [Rhodospirillaceae bacterium]